MVVTPKIKWYRSPIPRARLRELTQSRDLPAFMHAISFLAIYAGTTWMSLHFFLQQQWVLMVVAAYVHSVFTGFVGMGAAVHELSHGTAFKTRRLNNFFFKLFAFLTWNSYFHFKESHRRHHQVTGMMEHDREIKPEPIPFTTAQMIGWLTFDWAQFKRMIWTNVQHAIGNTDVDFFFWCPLLSKEDIKTKELIRWARVLIVGHVLFLTLFVILELWILVVTFTLGYFFGTFLVHGCEIQQHAGLSRDIPDWRVIAYTAKFGPIMSFLYWNMNYHIEHHMYAAVPFYNLPKLHSEIEYDLPYQLKGYWRGVFHVLKTRRMQRLDPDYRFMPEFPPTAHPPVLKV